MAKRKKQRLPDVPTTDATQLFESTIVAMCRDHNVHRRFKPQDIDRIDREHERRMADSRREMRRAAVRYMRSVFDDYYHGIKRKRPQ